MRWSHWISCSLGLWLLTLAALAAPELQSAQPLSDGTQGIAIEAQESLSYDIIGKDDKTVTLLLKGATLGQAPKLFPTNFGAVSMSQTELGVSVRVTFTQVNTPYQIQLANDNKRLVLQVTSAQVAQAPTPPETVPLQVSPPVPHRPSAVPAQPRPRPALQAVPQLQEGVSRVVLKARNQEARETLTLLSRISRTSIVVDPNIQARVTVNLDNVPFEDALKAITEIANLQFRREGDVYIVSQRTPQADSANGNGPEGGLTNAGDPRPRSAEDNPSLRLVSVIANDTEVGRVLKEMANQANVELVITGQLNDPVSVRLVNRTFEDALAQVLSGTTFGFTQTGNVFRVGDATPGTPTSKQFSKVEVLRLSNSSAKDVFDLLPPSFAALNQGIRLDVPRNSLIVSGPPSFQATVANYVKQLDTPIPEVSFGVKIVELNESGSQAFKALAAFQAGTGNSTASTTTGTTPATTTTVTTTDPSGVVTSTTTAPFIADTSIANSLAGVLNIGNLGIINYNNFARILSVVDGLVSSGKGRTLTDTKVSTISGQAAFINVAQDINVTTTTQASTTTIPTTQIQTITAGTTVTINPTVQGSGNVFTDIKVESSIPGSQSAPNVAPNVSRRQVANKIILHDGETVEIGGLLQSNLQENRIRFPILGAIPLIGPLLSDLLSTSSYNNTTSELLVFITAYINNRPQTKAAITQTDSTSGVRVTLPPVTLKSNP